MVTMSSMSTSPYISVMRVTRVYTSIRDEGDMVVTGDLLVKSGFSRNNVPRVGGWSARALVKYQLVRCSQSHAGQVKPPNSLITQYPDQIVDWIWSLAAGFSWAGTMGGVA